jgi:S1-C subfamily serine protease
MSAMKKISVLTGLCCWLLGHVCAQSVEYVNYNSFLNNAIGDYVRSGDTVLWKNTMDSLRKSIRSAREETPVALPAGMSRPEPGTKVLPDESVYSRRKISVVLVGRLRKSGFVNIGFEVMGTAFIISRNGHCVTNHHVLGQLIAGGGSDDDLLYFVITADRHMYPINGLMSYSRNNDLAIFSIGGSHGQLSPIPIGRPAPVGTTIYCISHPAGELYYFSKGIVARNIALDSANLGSGYFSGGKSPLRMQITADYGGGSSGGPILDKYGNLAGIVATTNTIYMNEPLPDGTVRMHPQMILRSAIPVKALTDLLK